MILCLADSGVVAGRPGALKHKHYQLRNTFRYRDQIDPPGKISLKRHLRILLLALLLERYCTKVKISLLGGKGVGFQGANVQKAL